MNELLDRTFAQFQLWLVEHELAPVHAARVWRGVYRDGVSELASLDDLPPRVRNTLHTAWQLTPLQLVRQADSTDGLTRKFLLATADGNTIETVLMRHHERWTACLSSQVGCPLGCVFCATGQAGYTRNLSTAEIVAQAVFVQRVLLNDEQTTSRTDTRGRRYERLSNIVVMGMGEPLLNYDAVLAALDILHEPAGMAIGAKQITLSTVGVVPGIRRLADERRPYSLAVSLHAATQADRAAMLPAARTWPLDELLDACRYYTAQLGRRIFIEWTLIAGANDSPAQARRLADLLGDLPVQVNLIPLNPTSGYGGDPVVDSVAVEAFRAVLRERGLAVSVRQRRGIDIAAGCGQLARA